MPKIRFLIAFSIVHSAIAFICLALAGLSQFNMHSTPARATTFTHVTETIGTVLSFPLALQTVWLSYQLKQDWIMAVGSLSNSLLWALAIWYLGVGIKTLIRRAAR